MLIAKAAHQPINLSTYQLLNLSTVTLSNLPTIKLLSLTEERKFHNFSFKKFIPDTYIYFASFFA